MHPLHTRQLQLRETKIFRENKKPRLLPTGVFERKDRKATAFRTESGLTHFILTILQQTQMRVVTGLHLSAPALIGRKNTMLKIMFD